MNDKDNAHSLCEGLRLKRAQGIRENGSWPVWLKPRKQGGRWQKGDFGQEQEECHAMPELVN